MKTSRLFGTDGIRGVAGEYPLDEPTVYVIGRALGEFLRGKQDSPRVLIGRDTRKSSPWIADTLAAGLAREQARAVSAGVIPTPGVAYLSRTDGFTAGIMISASHNPYRDNGIKVFAHSGYKLPDEDELAVEEKIFRLLESGGGQPEHLRVNDEEALAGRYVEFLASQLQPGTSFAGLRIMLDCANGAAFRAGPELFHRLGADVIAMATQPDGRNINLDCGSLHTENLQQRIRASGASIGVAFDGDGDRALFVTGEGELVNGDGVLFVTARHMRKQGLLKSGLVVGTIMSNLGLELVLQREGIQLLRTPVGDKYVLEEMLRRGANLGGEQSGHVIFSDHHTTGDGLLTALKVVETVIATGRPLDQLVADLQVFPQVIVNVQVREKVPIDSLPEVRQAIRESEIHFGEAGRVIVRYSGTESLARIMVEARDEQQVRDHAQSIADAFQRSVGA